MVYGFTKTNKNIVLHINFFISNIFFNLEINFEINLFNFFNFSKILYIISYYTISIKCYKCAFVNPCGAATKNSRLSLIFSHCCGQRTKESFLLLTIRLKHAPNMSTNSNFTTYRHTLNIKSQTKSKNRKINIILF